MAKTTFSGPVLEGKEGVNIETKASNYTVVATTDSGKTFVSSTDGVVFTLPAIAAGNVYKFVNAAEDGTNTLTISPNANDGIQYAGSATDNKDLIKEFPNNLLNSASEGLTVFGSVTLLTCPPLQVGCFDFCFRGPKWRQSPSPPLRIKLASLVWVLLYFISLSFLF